MSIQAVLQKTIKKPVSLMTNAKTPDEYYSILHNNIDKYSRQSFKSEKIIQLALALYMQKFGVLGASEESRKIYNRLITNNNIGDDMKNALNALIEHCDTETCALDKINYFFYTLYREKLI